MKIKKHYFIGFVIGAGLGLIDPLLLGRIAHAIDSLLVGTMTALTVSSGILAIVFIIVGTFVMLHWEHNKNIVWLRGGYMIVFSVVFFSIYNTSIFPYNQSVVVVTVWIVVIKGLSLNVFRRP